MILFLPRSSIAEVQIGSALSGQALLFCMEGVLHPWFCHPSRGTTSTSSRCGLSRHQIPKDVEVNTGQAPIQSDGPFVCRSLHQPLHLVQQLITVLTVCDQVRVQQSLALQL
eukprot:Skav216421  [mRNA]  locus=scaffold3139:54940:58584:+ [translate_table: standard]